MRSIISTSLLLRACLKEFVNCSSRREEPLISAETSLAAGDRTLLTSAPTILRRALRLILPALFLVWADRLPAHDLTTTNREALRNFWAATGQNSRPVTVLSFGDSMANSYRSITAVLMERLATRLGVAGYSFNNYQNNSNANWTNGTEVLEPGSFWFSTAYQVPPEGSLWWTEEWSPGGLMTDLLGVYYVAQPDGGTFTLSVSTNTDPWATLLTVDAYAPEAEGRFTNVAVSLDLHRLRIDGQTGTNIILGPQLLNSQSSGINIAFTDYPGIGVDQVTNVPLAIRGPIFRALAPDLLIWHMKEDGSEDTRQRLIECEEWWSNAVPNCSVLYIGTSYVYEDTTSTWTLDQNTIVRSVAVDYGRTYMDCMTPCNSYWWMLTNGFMWDGTHLNQPGSQYLANFVWNDLDLFALGTPRTLTIQPGEAQVNLSYQTSPSILYTVETSPDCACWQPLFTLPGDGQPVSTNCAATADSAFFRLRLQPATN
jgi:hypothetical protein